MAKKRWTTADIEVQTGRVAIVTGANSGIGFEAAKALAVKGATVVVASRRQERGEQAVASILQAAPDVTVELMRLDLDDLQWTERSFDRMASYGASKIANMLFTLELQRRLTEAAAPTIAAACHPGWTGTNLQRTSPLIRLLNPLVGMQPWQGALPTLYAAVSPDVVPGGYYGPDGLGTMRGYPASNTPAAASTDADAAKRLWTLSETLVGLETPALIVGEQDAELAGTVKGGSS